MATVPTTISNLIVTPNVHKNFRVHFPNGERDDITNENIVSESLEFTESVNSREYFHFGAAEKSVIKFETVGIENISGFDIECSLEFDTSSLSAAQLELVARDMAAHPEYIGELVSSADSDLGYGYFRVPLGQFVVETCPRDHTSQQHRAITALTPWDVSVLNPFETAKLALPVAGDPAEVVYSADAVPLALSQIFQHDPAGLSTAGMAKEAVTLSGAAPFPDATHFAITGPIQGGGNATIRVSTVAYTVNLRSDIHKMYSVEDPSRALAASDAAWRNAAVSAVSQAGFTFPNSYSVSANGTGTSVTINSAEELVGILFSRNTTITTTQYGTGHYVSEPYVYFQTSDSAPISSAPLDLEKRGTTIYGYGRNDGDSPGAWLVLPLAGLVLVDKSGSETSHYLPTRSFSQISVSAWRDPNADTDSTKRMNIQFRPKGTSMDVANFQGCFDALSIVNSYLDIIGRLARPSRKGGIELMAVSSPLSAFMLLPRAYEKLWWDDDAQPLRYGVIRYPYESGAQAADGVFALRDYAIPRSTLTPLGTPVIYDMSDNVILQRSRYRSDLFLYRNGNALSALVDDEAELEMPGHPHWLGGELIFAYAENGSAYVRVSRRTLRGIQFLHDSIESRPVAIG